MIIANSNTRDQVWLNDGHGRFSRIMNIPQQPGSTTVVLEALMTTAISTPSSDGMGVVKSCG